MTQEEVDGRWDQMDEKAQSKWGKLTRSERNVLGERWQRRNEKAHELYDISEEEAKRAIAVLHQGSPKMRNGLPGDGKRP